MPVLRLLADYASAFGTAGRRDVDGNPVFSCSPNDVAQVAVDCTGWIGPADTVDTNYWVTDLTTSGETTSGNTASVLVTLPDNSAVTQEPMTYLLTHTVTAASGRKRVTKIFLAA